MNLRISLVSILTISTFLFGCEPRDQKVTRPDGRIGTNGSPTSPAQVGGKADNYKYLAHLADRQVEAIEMYRALVNAEFVTEKKIVIEDINREGVKLKKISIKSESKKDGDFEIARESVLLAEVTIDENFQLLKAIVFDDRSQLSQEKIIKLDTKTEISIKGISKKIVFEKASNGSVNVSMELQDLMNVKTSKSFMFNMMKFNFAATNSNQDIFKIENVEMSHERFGTQMADFAVKSVEGTNLTVEMFTASKCATVSGLLHLASIKLRDNSTDPLYEYILSYDQSDLRIKSGRNSYPPMIAVSCENRPPVDLRKLF